MNKTKWHNWFAWYPVIVYGEENYYWAWLKTVRRMQVWWSIDNPDWPHRKSCGWDCYYRTRRKNCD